MYLRTSLGLQPLADSPVFAAHAMIQYVPYRTVYASGLFRLPCPSYANQSYQNIVLAVPSHRR